MSDNVWLKSLITDTPQEGFNLAVLMSRKGVAVTQPDPAARERMRPIYAENPDSLTMASQVIAINFQTVAAANNYWKV